MATPSHPSSSAAITPPATAAFKSPRPAIDRLKPFGMMPRRISVSASAAQSRQSGEKKPRNCSVSVLADISALQKGGRGLRKLIVTITHRSCDGNTNELFFPQKLTGLAG